MSCAKNPEVHPDSDLDSEVRPEFRPARFTEIDPAIQERKRRANHRRGKKMPPRPAGWVEIKGPRDTCTGCPNYNICIYPCDYMEETYLPAREVANNEYPEYWRRRQTQYVLDHEDDIKGRRWRYIFRHYFRRGVTVEKIARKLGSDPSSLEREIDRIVAHCWEVDRWRNRVACIKQQMQEAEEQNSKD